MNTTSSSTVTLRHIPRTGDRALRALAAALALLGESLVLATVWLWLVTGLIDEIDDLVRLGDVIFAFASCAVALLILQKHPRHRIGWLLVAVGLLGAYTWFGEAYGWYTYVSRLGRLPFAAELDWLAYWLPGAGSSLLVWVLLLFPSGHLLGRRWAWVGWSALLVSLPTDILYGVAIWRYRGLLWIAYPLPFRDPLFLIADQISTLSAVFVHLCTMLAVVALFLRLRRASGVERQQIKWLFYGASYLAATMLYWTAITLYFGREEVNQQVWKTIWRLLYIVAPGLLPAAIGIAILRHRLWEVDLLIRRTLLYSALTLVLTLLYAGGVIGLQAVFDAMTGQRQHTQEATVLSTLAIAGVFVPLRRRLQEGIDRRFYRRKYDAAQVLLAFAGAARNEVELDRLAALLVYTVEQTLQPTRVALWLSQANFRRAPDAGYTKRSGA